MATKQQIELAANLYELRDRAKRILGDGYAAKMQDIGQRLQAMATRDRVSVLQTAIHYAKRKSVIGLELVLLMAAAVEMTEPSESAAPPAHHCHWPDCDKEVPPAMWGCRQHWFTLPANLRNRIWKTYKPGQEITKTPSAEYIAAAKEVQEWIAARPK